MIMGCLFTNPAGIAVQCETFGEYVIQGLGIKFCTASALYFCRKLIGFTLLCMYNTRFLWNISLKFTVLIFFINLFSVQNVVSRFAIAAMIAKICATGTIILFGAYILLIKGIFTPKIIMMF